MTSPVTLTRPEARRIAVRAQLLDATIPSAAPDGVSGSRAIAADVVAGSGAAASGLAASGLAGSGAADRGAAGSGLAGSGAAGSGVLDSDIAALVALVRRLTSLQMDFTAAVAPSADLVAWSRLGRRYRPEHLSAALARRALVVPRGMIRPAADMALYLAEMRRGPGPRAPDWQRSHVRWVEVNGACRLDILARLSGEGPLLAQEIPDRCVVPWRSSGWTNDRNVMKMLECLEARGEVAVAGYEGRTRLWDLASRVYPDVEPVPIGRAGRIRAERRLRALGIARERTLQEPTERVDVGVFGLAAVVDGVRGTWRVDPDLFKTRTQPIVGRTALLSPLDRLVFDRQRLLELFGYDYQLEMYKPATKRRWGYFALPILCGDEFVGKLDATADRAAGVLRVAAVHPDVRLTPALRDAIDHEIDELAAWLGLDLVY